MRRLTMLLAVTMLIIACEPDVSETTATDTDACIDDCRQSDGAGCTAACRASTEPSCSYSPRGL